MTKRWIVKAARARSIWDSRGRPTIEVELTTSTASARGIAPAGASTGSFEARELRDADGLGVATACERFTREIAPQLVGADVREQERLDALLCELDGTVNLARIGGNTVIATSLAVLNTAAAASNEPLWRYLGGTDDLPMPTPEIQIIGGGAHAQGRIDLQDLMAFPIGAPDWSTALDWCARLHRAVGAIMADERTAAGVADEGGHWPNVAGNERAIELLVRGIERAGLSPGRDVAISLDIAATQLASESGYRLRADAVALSSAELIERLLGWTRRYPVVLVEDPAAESDLDGFRRFRREFAPQGHVIGDDLVVTDAERIRAAWQAEAIDAALIKPNQAGTVTRTLAALRVCSDNGVMPIVSARSGETEDVTLLHLAVGWRAPIVKVGSITRGERTAKWNEGIRIAERLVGRGALRDRTTLRL
jgi:enolase